MATTETGAPARSEKHWSWFPGAQRRVHANFHQWHKNVVHTISRTSETRLGFIPQEDLAVSLLNGNEQKAIMKSSVTEATIANGLLDALYARKMKVATLAVERFVQYQTPQMPYSWLGVEFKPCEEIQEERDMILEKAPLATGQTLPVSDDFSFRMRIGRGDELMSPSAINALDEVVSGLIIPSPKLEIRLPVRPHFN